VKVLVLNHEHTDIGTLAKAQGHQLVLGSYLGTCNRGRMEKGQDWVLGFLIAVTKYLT
jgi:hypothetical protein